MQLYIHIPFCKQKCRYCDFNSYACVDDALKVSYFAALNRELKFAAEAYSAAKISTVYIGGGTPSAVESVRICNIIKQIKDRFDCSELEEVTIECNPESMTEEKLSAYRQCGIDRISIGVQSLDDRNLRSVGRLHDAAQALDKLALAAKYFDNISADVIIGLPYDSAEAVRREASVLAPLVQHMSAYQLTLEEGTELARRVREGKVMLPTDDEVADMQDAVIDALAGQGFERYEVSNFAREGRRSKHNMGYWTGREYIGLGAGAHSYVATSDGEKPLAGGLRFASPKDLNAYIAGVNCASDFQGIPRAQIDVIDAQDGVEERIMLGLRTSDGVNGELLKGRIPDDLARFFERKGDNLRLNRDGMAVMNSILIKILKI